MKKSRSKETMKKSDPPPMQPVVEDAHGTLRFRENALIRYIVDHAGDGVHPGAQPVPGIPGTSAIDPSADKPDIGELMSMDFPQADKEQFAQLMGYSVAGYHELSFVSAESCALASVLAEQVRPGSPGGCRDAGCPLHGGPLFSEEGRRLT